MTPLSAALIQINAGHNPADNLHRIRERIAGMPKDLDLIALPEVFAFRGTDADYRAGAEPVDGPMIQMLQQLAQNRHAWILAGSIIEKADDRIFNTSVLVDRSGRIAAAYRKIHLFEAHLEDGTLIREADAYESGETPVLTDIDGWQTGLSICYDLRFPELYRHYSRQGAQLLLVPSNFTQRTGRDHWETLVRARAIENQCFVIAPNQGGANPATHIESYGHSMIVGPWGDVLANADTDETVLTATLDPTELDTTRHRVPALQHRRLP